ncbi:MAG: TIGR00269 family protein [Methanoregulaceae archaeon]|nr:TIGR00269 family protein [Methanoregulaceae archaeon]
MKTPADQRTICCDSCSLPAVSLDPLSGAHFCASHFNARFEDAVARTITESRMILPGDRVAVALSGGKDSTVLAVLLAKLHPDLRDSGLVAITVDEGIAGYREETVGSACKLCERLGIGHLVVSFGDRFGATLDAMVRESPKRACTICGVLRRTLLQQAAAEWGATKVATGHCLDDESETALMNCLSGAAGRISHAESGPGAGVPRIKPLRAMSEKDITLYALLNDIPIPRAECPYARTSLRAEVRGMMGYLEYRYPGTAAKVVEGYSGIAESLRRHRTPLPARRCTLCGQPSSGEHCQCCTILRMVGQGPEPGAPTKRSGQV